MLHTLTKPKRKTRQILTTIKSQISIKNSINCASYCIVLFQLKNKQKHHKKEEKFRKEKKENIPQ